MTEAAISTRIDSNASGAMKVSCTQSPIAYLLQNYPKYSETFILNELLEHQRQGRPMRVIALRFPREGRFHGCLADLEQAAEYVPESYWDKPDKRREAIRVAIKASPKSVARAVSRWLRRQADFRDLWQAAIIRRWAERRGVKHVHVHFGGYAARVAFLSRLMGGPTYSITLHAFDIFRKNVNIPLLRDMIEASAFCVTVSRFNARYLRESVGANPDRVRLLYNGIPLSRFPFSDAPRESGTILSVGRLIEKKGFHHLIRACAILNERGLLKRCEIVGEGPMKDELKAEISRLNLKERMKLVGAWPQEKVAESLRRAAVFALPCIEARDGNMDALPTVLLEAMAAGCPCVSTRLSGIPEIIEDQESGRLANPGDESGLANAIAEILATPSNAMNYALVGRQRAENLFDGKRAARTLRTWLDEAVRAEGAGVRDKEPMCAERQGPPGDAPCAEEVLA